MGLFNGKYLREIEHLQNQLNHEKRINAELGITSYEEAMSRIELQKSDFKIELAKLKQNKISLEEDIKKLRKSIKNLNSEIKEKQKEVSILDNTISIAEFGLYTPQYPFSNSEQYKDKLIEIRQKQKTLVKDNKAVNSPVAFTLDGSVAKGKAMVKDNIKQILRSFNNECDVLIMNVKFNTVEKARQKIEKSFESLNKMNTRMSISINSEYLSLKLQELNLAYEYSLKKQEEKEAQKEERARLREEAKIQKEIEEARKAAEKEQTHYKNALKKLMDQLKTDPNNNELLDKKEELENRLDIIDNNLKDIDYREANKRAGYVYIISNIGSFGENVYKIGMTRRLEPLERVNELGDASVPFNFDIHAMIFSDDAPSLENALHKAFENKKVNMINTRREFFNVTLDEIKEVIKENFDKTVEFNSIPEAEQYRESLIIKQNL